MFARTTRIASLTVFASLIGFGSASQAGHGSYAFGGRQVGCGGEVHMIHALSYIEQAFATECGSYCRSQIRAVLAAHAEVDAAEQEVHSPYAGKLLSAACASLSRYSATYCEHDLASAGRLISRALQYEQQYHLSCHSHSVGHSHGFGQSYGSGHGYGHGYAQPSRGFGLSVQGRHGGVSFRFGR